MQNPGGGAFIAFAICVATMSSYSANLIVNGSFEDEGTYMPVGSSGNGTYAYGSDGSVASPWTFSGYAGLCVTNSAFLKNILGYDIGTYAMFLRQTASAQQTFTVTEPGCYRLSFRYWADLTTAADVLSSKVLIPKRNTRTTKTVRFIQVQLS